METYYETIKSCWDVMHSSDSTEDEIQACSLVFWTLYEQIENLHMRVEALLASEGAPWLE